MSLYLVEPFFDKATFTLTYVVYDENTKDAVIIDPVLDYDPPSSKISFHSIEKVQNFIKEKSLLPKLILETHAHADHLTGADELKNRFPGLKVAIGNKITIVQELFRGKFNLKNMEINGSQFDILLGDNEIIEIGSIKIKTLFTPGHTPACASFLIDDMVFTGDALFMPNHGTGRCDFPAGNPKDLYHSIHEKLYLLPDSTKVYTGHNYPNDDESFEYLSTIKENKASNIQLSEGTTEEEFVTCRNKKDKDLPPPRLLLPSIQININSGKLPIEEDNGVSYLKMPLSK